MKRKWLSLIALVMVAVLFTPVIALGGTNIFYVDTANKKSLNMRSDCTMGDNIIANIPYRAEVTVYEFLAGDTWARVEYNGRMGFVMTRYLSGTRPAASGGSGGGSSSSTTISYKRLCPRLLHGDGQALQSLGLCQHALGAVQVHGRAADLLRRRDAAGDRGQRHLVPGLRYLAQYLRLYDEAVPDDS